jgi:hypothetical protein
MSRVRLLLSGAALLWLGGPAAWAVFAPADVEPVATVPVVATPVPLDPGNPGREAAGTLVFRGGLMLRSADKRFGGLSDMLWEPECGRLLAITDTGYWLALEPAEQDGRLVGVRAAWMAPLLGPDGTARKSKAGSDAEALTRTAGGATWVWFEQDHRGWRYQAVSACRPESLGASATAVLRIPEMADWPRNGGAEAVAARNGKLLILSESADAGDGRAALEAGEDGSGVVPFVYVPPAGYSPTALSALGEDGRFLVLNRRLSFPAGFSAVVAEAEVAAPPAGTVRPRVLARLAPPLSVDNMEAMAVREEAGGRSVYLGSDDNFMPFQRTLLLKFGLKEGPR